MRGGLVALRRQRRLHRQHAGAAEAGVDGLHAQQRAQQQAAGDEQHQTAGDLRRHQQRAQGRAGAAQRPALAQAGEAPAAGAQGRDDAEGDAGGYRDQQGEPDQPRVEAAVGDDRQLARHQVGEQRPERRREGDAEAAAEQW